MYLLSPAGFSFIFSNFFKKILVYLKILGRHIYSMFLSYNFGTIFQNITQKELYFHQQVTFLQYED